MLESMRQNSKPTTPMCRSWRRRQMSWKELFPHARIINDPKKLAELNVEIEKCKLGGSKPISSLTRSLGLCRNM